MSPRNQEQVYDADQVRKQEIEQRRREKRKEELEERDTKHLKNIDGTLKFIVVILTLILGAILSLIF